MYKVVLDTNIYISALHSPQSNLRKLLQQADKGYFKLFISKQTLAEIRGVLKTKFAYDLSKIDLFETLILSIAQIVEPKKQINVIKSDPEDNKILECAVEAKVDFIISGDKHLLNLKKYSAIKIISASYFLQKFKS